MNLSIRRVATILLAGLATSAMGTAQSTQACDPAEPVAAAAPAATDDPADWRTRRKELVRQLFGLQAAVETLPGTAFDTARNFPKEWGRTWSGVGKRYANQYGQFLISETAEFAISAIHHEDPRYFRLGSGFHPGRRMWHALASTWVARNSAGDGNKVALGRITGVYGSWVVAQRWSPDSVQGFGSFVLWGSFGMLTKSGVNEIREFWPDLKKRFGNHGSEHPKTRYSE